MSSSRKSGPSDSIIALLKKTDEIVQKYDEFWAKPLDEIIDVYLDEKSPDSRKAYTQFILRLKHTSEKDKQALEHYKTSLEDKLEKKEYLAPRQLALLSKIYWRKEKKESKFREKAVETAKKAVSLATKEKKDALGARDILGFNYIYNSKLPEAFKDMHKEFMKSIEEGSTYGLKLLSSIYSMVGYMPEEHPEAIPENEDPSQEALLAKSKALELQAIQDGGIINMDSQVVRDLLHENPDLLIQSVAEGSPLALFILADYHRQADNLVTAEQLALKAFNRDKSYHNARLILSHIAKQYLHGDVNVQKDEKKALKIYRTINQNYSMGNELTTLYSNLKAYNEPVKSYIVYHTALSFHPEELNGDEFSERISSFFGLENLRKEFKALATNNPALFDELLREDSLSEVETNLSALLGDALAKQVLRRSEVYVRSRDPLLKESIPIFSDLIDNIQSYEMDESHLASKKTAAKSERKLKETGIKDPRLLRQPTSLSDTKHKHSGSLFQPSTPREDSKDKKEKQPSRKRRKSF